MTEILLGVVAVLVVGLPLLALAADRVLPAFRNKPVAPTAMARLAREHGLAGADVAEVEAAVNEGRAVRRPRLAAAAAVAHAEHVLSRDPWDRPVDRPRRLRGRRRRVLLVGLTVAYAGLVVGAVLAGQSAAVFGPVFYLLFIPFTVVAWRRCQTAARASVEANRPATARVEEAS